MPSVVLWIRWENIGQEYGMLVLNNFRDEDILSYVNVYAIYVTFTHVWVGELAYVYGYMWRYNSVCMLCTHINYCLLLDKEFLLDSMFQMSSCKAACLGWHNGCGGGLSKL